MNLIGIGAGLGGLLKGYEQAGSYLQQQNMNALRIQQAQQQMQQEQQLNQLLDNPALFSQFSQGGGQMPAIGTGMAGGGVDPSQLPNTSMMGPQAATPPPGVSSPPRQPAMAPTPMPQMQPAPTRYADPFDPSQTPAPQPPQPRQAAGGPPDTMVPDKTLDLIERDESGGRNIMQTAYSGEGINPSTGTHTAPSTAQGYYQITNSTWREAAPQAGVDVSQYPTAMSAPKEIQRQVAAYLLKTQGTAPWAPYNAKLRADLGQGGGEDTLAASASPQVQKQAQTVAQNSLWNIPPQMYGRMQLQTAAQMIEKAAPNAPGHIKFLALERMQKLLAPDAKIETQLLMMEMRDQLRREFREDYPPQGGAGTIVQDKSGNTFLVNPRDPTHPTQIPLEGAQKLGTKGGARSMPAMIMQKYAEEHPNATADELSAFAGRYRREQAIESAFGGGIMGRNMVALNTVADHLSLLTEYADALKNNEIPRANQVLNRFATETGHPEVTNFETARDIAADEVVRLLTTTGGTEADRQGMQARFSAAGSPEQLAGAIEAAGKFVAGRFDALEQQYAGNDQTRRQMFENEMITPEARKWYQRSKRPATAPDETQGTKPQEPQAKPGGKQYPTVTSQEQYDALPEGAYFFDGSGNFGQKPKAAQ